LEVTWLGGVSRMRDGVGLQGIKTEPWPLDRAIAHLALCILHTDVLKFALIVIAAKILTGSTEN
jgi:hypothetical protein